VKIKVLPFKQEGVQLYAGVVRAEDIISLGEVDVYRQEGGTFVGYQREPEQSRTGKVAQYLKHESKPLLPTSVLLSYRGKLTVKDEHVDIPTDTKVYIVDGQHRVYGVKRDIENLDLGRFRDYPLPVIIIENMQPEEEANQFRIINETMKKVRTDLARRLLALKYATGIQARHEIRAGGREWEATAAEVIRILSTDAGSPWINRIQPPNSRKQPEHIIRELSFSTSLKPVINQRPYSTWTAGRIADKIKNLWLAFARLMPDAFENPDDYVIQKTPGVFSIHLLAFAILEEMRVNGIVDPTVDDFVNIIDDLGDYVTLKYWEVQNPDGAAMAGGMAGFNLIYKDMVEQLTNAGKLTT
jgi:DGQHR domain-containing protein